METLGADIDHALWSARCLKQDPAMIRRAHLDFYAAGAGVGITASYQAHFDGFAELGIGREAALELVQDSVRLAKEAAAEAEAQEPPTKRLRNEDWPTAAAAVPAMVAAAVAPALVVKDARSTRGSALVAGSVGPYGASLHNGAEYTGVYPGMDEEKLLEWHRHRAQALVQGGCDVLACETVPCLMEARALVRLVRELEHPAWLTFSCSSGDSLCSGESFEEAVKLAASADHIVGVGVNCTPPEHVAALVQVCARAKAAHQHVVVYPNSGEEWDGERHTWKEGTATRDERFVALAREWAALGADCIGGCCRTGPSTIAALGRAFAPPV